MKMKADDNNILISHLFTKKKKITCAVRTQMTLGS